MQRQVTRLHDDPPIEDAGSSELVIPLHAEQVDVTRVRHETGKVRIATLTRLREQQVEQLLTEMHAHVEHIDVGTIVATMPDIRQEGETTIIPIVEEVLVTEKKLFLKQEIHITRVSTNSVHRETVVLREQEAVVTRIPGFDPVADLATSNMDGEQDEQ